MILDAVVSRRLSWSLHALTGVGVVWLFITLLVTLARRPIAAIAGLAAATAVFLVAIDLFDGRLEWFVPLALTIVGVVTAASLFVWLVIRRSHRAPAVIAAAVLCACGAGSVALDLLISAHLGTLHMGWWFTVLGAVMPPMTFLLYLHFRLGRKIDMARILHT